MRNYLDFEKEIKNLEEELDSSKNPFDKDGISEVDTNKIQKIQEQINEKLEKTYSTLNSWQKTMVARHEDRPRANFYIKEVFSDFTLLSRVCDIIISPSQFCGIINILCMGINLI